MHTIGIEQLENELSRRAQAAARGETVLVTDRGKVVGLDPSMLERALRPFPIPVRALDAIHLATAGFLARRVDRLQLATYDGRRAASADALGIPLVALT